MDNLVIVNANDCGSSEKINATIEERIQLGCGG